MSSRRLLSKNYGNKNNNNINDNTVHAARLSLPSFLIAVLFNNPRRQTRNYLKDINILGKLFLPPLHLTHSFIAHNLLSFLLLLRYLNTFTLYSPLMQRGSRLQTEALVKSGRKEEYKKFQVKYSPRLSTWHRSLCTPALGHEF